MMKYVRSALFSAAVGYAWRNRERIIDKVSSRMA